MMSSLLGGEAIEILVTLKDLTAGGIGKVNADLTKLSVQANVTGKATGGLKNDLSGLVSPAMLAAGAATALVGVLGEALKAASDDEQSISGLTASLKANVPGWNGNSQAIEDYISSAEKASAFNKDDLRTSLESLVGATHDVAKAEALQTTATNLARFAHIDLATATGLVIKTNEGVYRGLAPLGIKIKATTDSMTALGLVNSLVAGQDTSYLNTEAGQMEELGNQIHDTEVELGEKLLPVFEKTLKFINSEFVPALNVLAKAWGLVLSGITAGGTNVADQYDAAMAQQDKAAQAWVGEIGNTRDEVRQGLLDTASGIDAAGTAIHKAVADTTSATLVGWDSFETQVTTKVKKGGKTFDEVVKGAYKLSGINLNPPIIPDSTKLKNLEQQLAKLEALKAREMAAGAYSQVAGTEGDINTIIGQINAINAAGSLGTVGGGNKRAGGGPTYPGLTYLVGERGPELLKMGNTTSGYVVPNDQMGGGGTRTINLYLDHHLVAQILAPDLDQIHGRRLALMGTSALG